MKHIVHSAVTFTLLIQLFGSGAALSGSFPMIYTARRHFSVVMRAQVLYHCCCGCRADGEAEEECPTGL